MTLLSSEESFVAASSVLQEILTNSTMTGGYGTRTLTIPLLSWLIQSGRVILEQSLASEFEVLFYPNEFIPDLRSLYSR